MDLCQSIPNNLKHKKSAAETKYLAADCLRKLNSCHAFFVLGLKFTQFNLSSQCLGFLTLFGILGVHYKTPGAAEEAFYHHENSRIFIEQISLICHRISAFL